MKVALEQYVYFHTQSPGFQVRWTKIRNGKRIADYSRYFSFAKYGRRNAKRKAINYKYMELFPRIRGRYGLKKF